MRERAVAYGYALLLNIWCNRGRQLRLINEDRSLDFLLGVWRESVSSWALKSQAKLTVPILQWCENTNWISQRVSLKGKTYQMACKPRRYQLHDGWLHGHPTWVFSASLTVQIRHGHSPRVVCWPAQLSPLGIQRAKGRCWVFRVWSEKTRAVFTSFRTLSSVIESISCYMRDVKHAHRWQHVTT